MTVRVSKTALWAGRIVSALPVLLMVMGAAMALFKPEMVKEGMQKHGYPASSAMPIIIVEMVCVALYVIPQTAVLGAILLTGYLGGATATHVRVSEPFVIPVVVGVLVWLGLFLRDPRVRELIPLRSDAMTLKSQRELDNTREKLRLLESMHAEASAETEGDAEVREAELESLQRQIKQLKEEIARYEAHHTVRR